MCSSEASSMEHFPPKCFFPKKQNLQLWTVPSCPAHNNKKSGDDQYFFTQVVMNMSRQGNLAQERFIQSIAPHFEDSPKFLEMIAIGSKKMENGKRAYQVYTKRMFNVMDGICHAIIFQKYGEKLNSENYSIRHKFLNFISDDAPDNKLISEFLAGFDTFLVENSWSMSTEIAAQTTEEVYSYKIFAPLDLNASITLEHCLYGGFKVISFLTNKKVSKVVKAELCQNF